MILALVLALILSFIMAMGNTVTKYTATIIYTVTLLCMTALIITGHIGM